MTVRVLVDDNFHYMDESERYQLGVFDTVEEAVSKCREIIDADLAHMAKQAKPGLSAEALYELYMRFGEDPFIICEGADEEGAEAARAWSAWDYAKSRCNDMVLPVVEADHLKATIHLGARMADADARRMLALKKLQVQRPDLYTIFGLPPAAK